MTANRSCRRLGQAIGASLAANIFLALPIHSQSSPASQPCPTASVLQEDRSKAASAVTRSATFAGPPDQVFQAAEQVARHYAVTEKDAHRRTIRFCVSEPQFEMHLRVRIEPFVTARTQALAYVDVQQIERSPAGVPPRSPLPRQIPPPLPSSLPASEKIEACYAGHIVDLIRDQLSPNPGLRKPLRRLDCG